MPRGDLENGWARKSVIRDLAAAEKSQNQIAAEYGVSQGSVSEFAARHRDEIERHRQHLDDEWYGLWIAQKRHRVAEYQADVERITDALDNETDPALLRAKLAILRQTAEELGQFKQEIEVTGTLTYVVEGVDMGQL